MKLLYVGAVAVLALGAGIVAFALASGGSENTTPGVAAGSGTYRGSEPPAGNMLPTFSLRNYTGETFQSESVRGKVALVTFLETKCREACPGIAAAIAQGLVLMTRQERRQVAAIAVSTHPIDDTPGNVQAFVQRHRLLGKLSYLIGSERELRPVWKAFHVLSALDSGNADTHSASVRVFDPQGEWVATLHLGVDLTPDNLAHDLRSVTGLRWPHEHSCMLRLRV